MEKIGLIILAVLFMSFIAPLKKNKGQKTDFGYYSDKYDEYWELNDSTMVSGKKVYIYKLGGQEFRFNEDGDAQ